MGAESKIEWTDHTFNPWIGCHHVSPGCDYCYAESMARRNWPGHWGPPATTPRRLMSEAYWRQPERWNAEAKRTGVRQRVFCASLADVWEPHPAVVEARRRLLVLIEATPHLDWLLLTKRPEMIPHLAPWWCYDTWPDNAWVGCTVENQEQADRRIPHLLRVPARVRFLSCEPLLGGLDLRPWLWTTVDSGGVTPWGAGIEVPAPTRAIDWVICGGESGPHARPMHPDWPRRLRDDCLAAGVAFFFKQWGEWAPTTMLHEQGVAPGEARHPWGLCQVSMTRVGKRAAGRLLDGRTWDELPGGTNGNEGTNGSTAGAGTRQDGEVGP